MHLNVPSDAGIDGRAVARAMGTVRVALGLSFLIAPGLALRAWPGRRPAGDDHVLLELVARSTGGRDIALGAGLLLALSHQTPVRGWLEAGVLADTVDALAILLALRHLPRAKAVLMFGAATGGAIAGRRLASSLG